MSRVFYFHYNKPLARKLGRPMLTLHYCDKCMPVDRIHCGVPSVTHKRKTQPHIVMKGRCDFVKLTRRNGLKWAIIGSHI